VKQQRKFFLPFHFVMSAMSAISSKAWSDGMNRQGRRVMAKEFTNLEIVPERQPRPTRTAPLTTYPLPSPPSSANIPVAAKCKVS
jgi:hypothetical protein